MLPYLYFIRCFSSVSLVESAINSHFTFLSPWLSVVGRNSGVYIKMGQFFWGTAIVAPGLEESEIIS